MSSYCIQLTTTTHLFLVLVHASEILKKLDDIWTHIQRPLPNDPQLPLPKTDPSEDKPKQADYPNVRFWYRNEWEAFIVESKANSTWHQNTSKTGPCDSLAFIMDSKGTAINRIQAGAIRQFARGLWQTLAHANRDPPTWGNADLSVIKFYRSNMYSDFPDLRLCDNDWKVDMIAQRDYPSWHRSHGSNFHTTKTSVKRSMSEFPEGTNEAANPTKKLKSEVTCPKLGLVPATNGRAGSSVPTLSSCAASTTSATTRLDPPATTLSVTQTSVSAVKSKPRGKEAIICHVIYFLNPFLNPSTQSYIILSNSRYVYISL